MLSLDISKVLSWLNKLFAPRVRLYFDPNQTFHNVPNTLTAPNVNIGASIWVHICVRNRSRRTFKNVRAVLMRVWTKNKMNQWIRMNGFNVELPLHWAHTGGKFTKDVLPERQKAPLPQIDLFMIPQLSPSMNVATNVAAPTGTIKQFPSGHYIFGIVCEASNAKTGNIFLEVTYSGGFQNPTVIEVSENDLKRNDRDN